MMISNAGLHVVWLQKNDGCESMQLPLCSLIQFVLLKIYFLYKKNWNFMYFPLTFWIKILLENCSWRSLFSSSLYSDKWAILIVVLADVISGTILYRHKLLSAFVQIKTSWESWGEKCFIDLHMHCCFISLEFLVLLLLFKGTFNRSKVTVKVITV